MVDVMKYETNTIILILTILSFCTKEVFSCEHPGEPSNGGTLPDKKEYKVGDEITFVCSDDFVLMGDNRATCLENSTWSSPLPHCALNKQTLCSEEETNILTDRNEETCVTVRKNSSFYVEFAKSENLKYLDIFYIANTSTLLPNVKVFIDEKHSGGPPKKTCEHLRNGTYRWYKNIHYLIFNCHLQDKPQLADEVTLQLSSSIPFVLKLCEIETEYSVMLNPKIIFSNPSPRPCLNHFTDGNVNSGSTLTLSSNRKRTVHVTLGGFYAIEIISLTMDMVDRSIQKQNEKRKYVEININIGNFTQEEQGVKSCNTLYYDEGDWNDDTILIKCRESSPVGNTVILEFLGNKNHKVTAINLREFQVLSTEDKIHTVDKTVAIVALSLCSILVIGVIVVAVYLWKSGKLSKHCERHRLPVHMSSVEELKNDLYEPFDENSQATNEQKR